MTKEQVSKVWSVLGLLLLYYAVNTYLVTQGGEPIFGATLISSSRIPAAALGIPICSLLLLVGSFIGIDYARKGGAVWAARIPVVGFEKINAASREGKLYQGAMLALLSLVPLVCLAHFWILFVSADVVTTKNPAVRVPSIWSWSALTSLNDPARICSSVHVESDGPSMAGNVSCENNMTILPGLEPSVFALLTLAAVGATIVFWLSVFRAPSSRKH
jgi:hypothetical protein